MFSGNMFLETKPLFETAKEMKNVPHQIEQRLNSADFLLLDAGILDISADQWVAGMNREDEDDAGLKLNLYGRKVAPKFSR